MDEDKTSSFTKNTGSSDRMRIERLYRAVDLFEWCNELVNRVYHLGIPYFTDAIPTASLTVVPSGAPQFEFNRRFFDGLGEHELVFVVLHEALHYAFRHHERRQRRLPAVWNIACDLVVNVFLLERVGFNRISDTPFRQFIDSAVTFQNLRLTPARNGLSLSAEEVYELLEKDFMRVGADASRLQACDEHPWAALEGTEQSISASLESEMGVPPMSPTGVSPVKMQGQGGPAPHRQDAHATPDRLPKHALSDSLEELASQAQRCLRETIDSWGDREIGEFRAIGVAVEPVRIGWDQILAQSIASGIRLAFEQRWAPANRRIAWLYPTVLLPAEQEVEKLCTSILLAVDASGSIPEQVLERFFDIARGIPQDRIELTAISFDTRTYPLNVQSQKPQIQGGGGTSFDAVEQHAIRLQRYPDLVVVLSDGHAARPTISRPNRWFWLITQGGTSAHVDGVGRHCRIEDLVLNRPGDPR
jgi:predicted metal-dependent peptidase